MPDWTQSMQQTFEYYIVDPGTWRDVKLLDDVKSSDINWDSSAETLGSATIDVTNSIGECYVRIYLVTIQDGVKEKRPLGTFLVQSSPSDFDGKVQSTTLDAYTPLIELKENQPPLGYSLFKGDNIMDKAYMIVRDNVRAPVVETEASDTLYNDFVSDTEEKWISFVQDLIANAKRYLDLDEMGRILFATKQDTASLQPVVTFTDGENSIMYPDISIDRDLYGIPNVVEVIYSSGRDYYHAIVKNDDPNSPISTVNRGREIRHRVLNPDSLGYPSKMQVEEYAKQLLRELSSVECTINYTHAYYPVRINDCVRINYARAGLMDIKAKVISQSIKCEPGVPVTEKAVFTTKLWG